MPRAKEKAKRTGGEVLKVVLGVLGGIAATVIAAVSGELVKTDQFWETVGFRSEKITVKRAIVYGRIEYFSDKRLNDAKPFQIKEVGAA